MSAWRDAVYWAVWFSRIDGHKRFVYLHPRYGWIWRFSA